jgi:hypothetical protein
VAHILGKNSVGSQTIVCHEEPPDFIVYQLVNDVIYLIINKVPSGAGLSLKK